jgi:hypothetical protein
MKRHINALLAFFFIITTLTTSLHELMPHHDSSNCPVCTLVQHDNGLAPEEAVKLAHHSALFVAVLLPERQFSRTLSSTLNARAPPLFS